MVYPKIRTRTFLKLWPSIVGIRNAPLRLMVQCTHKSLSVVFVAKWFRVSFGFRDSAIHLLFESDKKGSQRATHFAQIKETNVIASVKNLDSFGSENFISNPAFLRIPDLVVHADFLGTRQGNIYSKIFIRQQIIKDLKLKRRSLQSRWSWTADLRWWKV